MLNEKFLNTEQSMKRFLFERDDEIHTSILALIGKMHHLQYGEPGVAKSLLVDSLCDHISDFGPNDKFSYLLTKFTAAEEVLGFLDFFGLTKDGVYRKVTDRRLPAAKIAFLDELCRSSSALINSLLRIMNERQFDSGEGVIEVPLISMFTATNSLPDSADLEALADRFHFWHEVKRIQDPSNKAELLRTHNLYESEEITDTITLGDIEEAHHAIDSVVISNDLIEGLLDILDKLNQLEINVSDRRARQAVKVVQAEAWLQGRQEAKLIDLLPLQHVFWKNPDDIDKVYDAVSNIASPIDKEIRAVRASINEMMHNFNKTMKDTQEEVVITSLGTECVRKLRSAQKTINELGKRAKKEGLDMTKVHDLRAFTEQQFHIIKTQAFSLEEIKDDNVYDN